MTTAFRDNPNNILGANTADNQYDSSTVAANADGSIIERQEYIQGLISGISAGKPLLYGTVDAGTNSTTAIVDASLAGYGDDFFNGHFYMQVLHNDNSATNAPEDETKLITDYVSSTGTFTCDAFSSAVQENDLIVILHESLVAIGCDNADNVFTSTNVVANADGSILERLEDLNVKITAVDDYVDTEVTTANTNISTLMGQVGGTDGATNVLGANNNNNTFASDQVAANADGSILERLEDIKDRVDAIDNYVDSEVAAIKTATDQVGTLANSGGTATLSAIIGDVANVSVAARLEAIDNFIDGAALEKLTGVADGGTNAYPDSVVQESVVAYLMSKSANPVTTSYDNTTDSLEAISDSVSALSSTLKLDKLISADDSAGATAYPDSVAQDSILAYLMSKSASPVTTSYNNTTDSLEAISDAIAAVDAKVVAVDDYVDTEVSSIKTATDGLSAAGALGTNVVRKTVTFSNTAADVNLFTVTGAVIAKIVAICDTNVESAAGCNIGVDAGSTAIIADTDCTAIEAGDIWHDASPDSVVEAITVLKEYIIANGTTILLDVEGAKQVDSGVITFVCYYTAVSSNGAVAAAA
jgi:tetrahydromethanopterin S-methyltransferase subunit B